MGVDAVLYAKVKNQTNVYNRIGLGLRFYYYTEPCRGEDYEQIIKFIGVDSLTYLNQNLPFQLHASYVNWISDLTLALNQVQEGIDYYKQQDDEEEEDVDKASKEKWIESGLYALQTLKNYILENIDNWECIVLVDDTLSEVEDCFIFDKINGTNKYKIIQLE